MDWTLAAQCSSVITKSPKGSSYYATLRHSMIKTNAFFNEYAMYKMIIIYWLCIFLRNECRMSTTGPVMKLLFLVYFPIESSAC